MSTVSSKHTPCSTQLKSMIHLKTDRRISEQQFEGVKNFLFSGLLVFLLKLLSTTAKRARYHQTQGETVCVFFSPVGGKYHKVRACWGSLFSSAPRYTVVVVLLCPTSLQYNTHPVRPSPLHTHTVTN